MSTIKADTLESATTNGDLTIRGNGTGVPNLESGSKLNGVAFGDAATATIGTDVLAPNGDGSSLTGISGGLVQTVQDEITAAVTITGSTSFTDVTGLAVTITPTSASNTILISGVLRISIQSGTGPSVRLVRDSTVIHLGDASGSEQRGLWSATQQSVDEEERIHSIPIFFVDTPATTSAVTYKFQIRNDNSGHTTYVNRTYSGATASQRARTASNLVAMELAV